MLKRYSDVIKKSFTFRRLWNIVKISTSYSLSLLTKKPNVWGYPPILMIEPTNICNLKCPLCPSGADTLTRSRGYMSYETFVRIVDEVYKDTFMLLLWNQGEPFMNPDICKMMEYAHKKGLYLMLSTNANVMPPAESLINCGLDLLIISLDGSTQETYSKYRVGGSLDVVVDHVSSIVKAKDKHKRKFPIIVWQFLVMKHNEHEIDDIKHLSRKLGVDVLALKTVQIYSPDDIDTYLPSEQKHRRYIVNKEKKEFSTPRFKNRCFRIWYQPVINYNGDMSMCCFDKDITYHIGNIYKSSLYRLWKSENFMNHREVILTDRKRYMICRNCGEGTKLQI